MGESVEIDETEIGKTEERKPRWMETSGRGGEKEDKRRARGKRGDAWYK